MSEGAFQSVGGLVRLKERDLRLMKDTREEETEGGRERGRKLGREGGSPEGTTVLSSQLWLQHMKTSGCGSTESPCCLVPRVAGGVSP